MKKHYRIEPSISSIDYIGKYARRPERNSNRVSLPIEFAADQIRPIGITIFCLLCMLSGVGLFGIYFLKPSALDSIFNVGDISDIYKLIYINSYSVIYILAAVFLWSGKKSGWALGIFSVLNTLFLQMNSNQLVPQIIEQINKQSFQADLFLTKYSLPILLSVLLIAYFFKASVIKYYNTNVYSATISLVLVVCLGLLLHAGIPSADHYFAAIVGIIN